MSIPDKDSVSELPVSEQNSALRQAIELGWLSGESDLSLKGIAENTRLKKSPDCKNQGFFVQR
jgi:hypothetical protein